MHTPSKAPASVPTPLRIPAARPQTLHTGLPRSAASAAADEGAPALNPLQQAPPPTAARSVLAPDTAAGAEGPLRARAVLRNTAISPRKLNMFAKVVRGLSVEDALIQCEVSCKKSAAILRNVVLSAKSNAVHNHGLDGDRLVVGECGGSGARVWLCMCVNLFWRGGKEACSLKRG